MRKTVLLISMLVLALLPLAAESQYKTIEDLNGRNIGVHSRFIDGTVLEPGFELDELMAEEDEA